MKKEKIGKLLLAIVTFGMILSIVILKPIGNLDELWNYNFARNVANGLIPYRDFNMVIMPLLPLISGFIIKITADQLIVMRIIAAIICSAILIMIYIIFNKLNIKKEISIIFTFIIGYLLKDYYCLDYNYTTLFITLLIVYKEIKNFQKDNIFIKYNLKEDLLLGILAGVTITLKQTTGMMITIALLGNKLLFVKNKKELIKYLKSFIYRLIGVFIPVLIILIYLLCNNAVNACIDYTIKGIKEFSNFISYKNLIKFNLIGIISILVPISFVYFWCKTIIAEKDKKIYFLLVYGMAMFGIVFPISDKIHFLIGATPTIILILYELYNIINILCKKILKNKKVLRKIISCIIIFISVVIILYTIFFEIKNIYRYIKMNDKYSTLNHYRYITITETLEKQIEEVDTYILNSNKEVKILDSSAALYMIPIDRYNKDYDMLNKGNFGLNGDERIIEKIDKEINQYFVLKDSYKRNWQTPWKIIEHVKNSKEKIGEIKIFDIYQ